MTPRVREWSLAGLVIGLAVLAVVGVWIYLQRENAALRSTLYVPHATKITPEVGLLQQYIRINTTNPPGNETKGARFLAAQLQAAGVASEIIESAPGRGNLYARIKGRKPGDGLLLLNHIDVVPARGKWTRPPFSGGIAINMVHGRGAIDMKGLAICELEAFIDVAQSGRTPEHDLVFLAVADEESGGSLGTRWLLEHRPDVFEGLRFALNEGGITEMERESITFYGIETGAKQITSLELTGGSRAALQQARITLEPFFDPPDPDRVLPGVRRYLQAVAPTRLENRETLVDIDKTIAAGKFWLLPDTYRALMTNTIRATGIEQRGPGLFVMRTYLFNLPDEDPDRRLAWLAAQVAPFGVTVGTIHQKQGPAPLSDDQTPLFATISREIERAYGKVPVGPLILAVSTNDSRYLRARGMTCYGFQPFRTDFFQSLSIHGANERVRVDWFDDGVRLMKKVVADYAFSAT